MLSPYMACTACLRRVGTADTRMWLCAACAALLATLVRVAGARYGNAQRCAGQPLLVVGVEEELECRRESGIKGACLLYDGLPVHSLGQGASFKATCDHIARPCVAAARELLARFSEAAGVDMAALRRGRSRGPCEAAWLRDSGCAG